MRRILGRIVHNWPLKLAAVGLATLMYGGLALSQNTQTYPGNVPVRVINQPPDTVLLAAPEPVKTIRYFAPSGVPVAASSFVATVDLEGVVPKDGLATAPIQVVAVDGRIRVLGYDPPVASIAAGAADLEGGRRPRRAWRRARRPDPRRDEGGPGSGSPCPAPESIIVRVVAVRADVLIQTAGLRHRPGRPAHPGRQPRERDEPGRCLAGERPGGHRGVVRPPEPDPAGQPDHHRPAGRRVRDRIR